MKPHVKTKKRRDEDTASALLADLCARIARGDEPALADFYDLTRRRVFGLCLAILRDSATAEDATVEVYTQIWRRAADYSPERGDIWVWILTIARTRALDAARARARREKNRQEIDTALDIASIQSDLSQTAAGAETAEIVRKALLSLPQNEREPIMIAYYTGRSYAETAAYLGLPEGTVKSRIRQGMATLKKCCASLEGESR